MNTFYTGCVYLQHFVLHSNSTLLHRNFRFSRVLVYCYYRRPFCSPLRSDFGAIFEAENEALRLNLERENIKEVDEKSLYIVILVNSFQESVADLGDWLLHSHGFRGHEAAQELWPSVLIKGQSVPGS